MGASIGVSLRLASGHMAANAKVALVDTLTNGSTLFETSADSMGQTSLPRDKSGLVLVRHEHAAFLVRPWPPEGQRESVEWVLPPASGRPLVIRVRDDLGDGVVRRAEITLRVGAWRLSGKPFSWLTEAPPFAGEHGFWSASNVPAGSVSILAYHPHDRLKMASGNWDMLATEIAAPWPEVVETRLVLAD